MSSTIRATLTKDSFGSFGVQFIEGAGSLIIDSVSEHGQAEGLAPGLRLVELIGQNGMEFDANGMSLRTFASILSRQALRVTLVCTSTGSGPKSADTLGALDGMISQELSPIHTLREILTPAEVQEMHAAAKELRDAAEADADERPSHDYDNTRLSGGLGNDRKPLHESVFLHERGFFQRAYPQLCNKVLAAVRGCYGGEQPLGVRCIEYHTYRVGGALLDPDHRDMGSMLTMSCLLSEPRRRAALVDYRNPTRGRRAAPRYRSSTDDT